MYRTSCLVSGLAIEQLIIWLDWRISCVVPLLGGGGTCGLCVFCLEGACGAVWGCGILKDIRRLGSGGGLPCGPHRAGLG